MVRWMGILVILALGVAMVYAGQGLPVFGDPESPAATHVGAYYIEHAYHDAHTPNFVTVMIADYRSFDTLGECVVVFCAGLACFLLLRAERRRDLDNGGGEE
jgi:multicomponent Na+:H+ antiporter subunit B